jgi:hypothetical protein
MLDHDRPLPVYPIQKLVSSFSIESFEQVRVFSGLLLPEDSQFIHAFALSVGRQLPNDFILVDENEPLGRREGDVHSRLYGLDSFVTESACKPGIGQQTRPSLQAKWK